MVMDDALDYFEDKRKESMKSEQEAIERYTPG